MKTIIQIFFLHLFFTITSAFSEGTWTDFKPVCARAWGGDTNNFRLSLVVDRTNGKLFVSRWFTGVWMSSDQAATFIRVDGNKVSGGGPFTAYDAIISPEGGKLAVFNMNNNPGPSAYSLDGGANWTSFTSIRRNWDYGAIDWNSGAILGLMHEDAGVEYSPDMGKTWTELALNRGDISGVGVFSAKELVISGWSGIRHSGDSGKTWSAVIASYSTTGPMQVFNGKAYWLFNIWQNNRWNGGMVVSTDSGKTWTEPGARQTDDMFCSGPFFGKDDQHLAVATLKGIMESRDGGKTWTMVSLYPAGSPAQQDHKNGCGFPALGYDPARDIFYVYLNNMSDWPGGKLLKYERGEVSIESAKTPVAEYLTADPVPFNPTLNIKYILKSPGSVDVSVYSISGKKIITLNQGFMSKGTHALIWNGRDGAGNSIPSGTYVLTSKTSTASWQKKVIYLK